MSRYEAVIFDMGYTLLGPHPSFEDLVVQTAARWEVPLQAEAIRAQEAQAWQCASRDAEVRGFTLQERHSVAFWSLFYTHLMRLLDVDAPAGLPQAFFDTFTQFDVYEFYEDVMPALHQMRSRGLRLGVVSNWETWLYDLLRARGAYDIFATVVISARVGLEKPDHRIFQIALDELGLPADKCIYIGDSVENDVVPSAELGLLPILIDRRGRQVGPPRVSCHRIRTLTELFDNGLL